MTRSSSPSPRIVFRVDSSVQLGSGHVMRCLTLARELRRRGSDITFICREHPGHLIDRIEQEGFDVDRLPLALSAHTSMGATIAEDVQACSHTVRRVAADWLIVDHYDAAGEWEQGIVGLGVKLFAIDDFARHRAATILLDQNWRGERPSLERTDDLTRLTGPRFALLGPEYPLLRRALRRESRSCERALLFFGGSDLTDETSKALRALSAPAFASIAVDVVIGRNHPHRDRVHELVAQRPRTHLHESLPSLAALMVRADVAIGAGGATTWERLCLRLPSLVTTIASNQEEGVRLLAAHDIVTHVGRASETTSESYERALARIPSIDGLANRLVDGLGTQRVAELLAPTPVSGLRLRRAVLEDAEHLLEWRNEPLARAMSFSSDEVPWSNHLKWFRERLESQRAIFFIAEAGELPVGQVRFDLQAECLLLSYSMDELVRGRGWSHWLVSRAIAGARSLVPQLPIHAKVKANNAASRRVFSQLGWEHDTAADRTITYRSG